MVHGCGEEGGADRLFFGKGLYGHPSCRLCHLGENSGGTGQSFQGDRRTELRYAASYSGISFREGKRARGRLCTRGGLGYLRRFQETGRAALRSSDLGGTFLRLLFQGGKVLQRFAPAFKPVVLRSAMGEDNQTVLKNQRILMAGGTYRTCYSGGSGGENADDAGHLCGCFGK